MNRYFRYAFYLLLLTVFSSCATLKKPENSLNPVYITNTKKVQLLPPSCFAYSLDSLQLFSGTFGERTFNSQVYVKTEKDSIVLILLNDFGIQTGTLEFDGQSCVLNSSLFPKSLKAEYILCDFENAYCTAGSLKQNYNSCGLIFTESVDAAEDGTRNTVRKIFDGQKLIEEIIMEGTESSLKNIVIKNYLREYTYELTEAEQ